MDMKNCKEYDEKGRLIHYKDSNGYEVWKEYDEEGNITHTRYSDGREVWWEDDKNNGGLKK